jgi:Outer membrane protein beta-barrel domain
MRLNQIALATLAVGALAVSPRLVAAQSRGASAPLVTGTMFEATPYAGYMLFGDYLSGPLGTSITNAPAPIVGLQLGMRIAPNVSIIGNLATANSDVQAGLPFLGGISIAKSSLLMYDAGLQLDLPLSTLGATAFSPFVQAGAGGMRYDLSEDNLISRTATNLAGNIGVGADIGIGSGVGIRLMAKDYIGKFDFQEATTVDISSNTAQSFAFSAGLKFSF